MSKHLAWPSAATMLTTQLDIFLSKFPRLSRTVKFNSHQDKITFFKCVTCFHIQYIPWIIHIIVLYMFWSGLFNQHPSWLLYWYWQIYSNHMPSVIFQSLHCTIYSNHPIQTSDMHLFDSGNLEKIGEVLKTNHKWLIWPNILSTFYCHQQNVSFAIVHERRSNQRNISEWLLS